MSILCGCGEKTIDLEGHLLRAHPHLASRGLCGVCSQVVAVGHCSAGAMLEEHGQPLCAGSGKPPRRNQIVGEIEPIPSIGGVP